jgi:hypothetical protein
MATSNSPLEFQLPSTSPPRPPQSSTTPTSPPRASLPSTPYPRSHPKHKPSTPSPTADLPPRPIHPNHIFVLNHNTTNRMSKLKLRMTHLPNPIRDFEAVPPATPPPIPRLVIPFDRPIALRNSTTKTQLPAFTDPTEVPSLPEIPAVYSISTETNVSKEEVTTSEQNNIRRSRPENIPQALLPAIGPEIPVMYSTEASNADTLSRCGSQMISPHLFSLPDLPKTRRRSEFQPSQTPSSNQIARLSLREEFYRSLLPPQLLPAQAPHKPELVVRTQFKQAPSQNPKLISLENVSKGPPVYLPFNVDSPERISEKQQFWPVVETFEPPQPANLSTLEPKPNKELSLRPSSKTHDDIITSTIPLSQSRSLPTPPRTPITPQSIPKKKKCKLRDFFRKTEKKPEPGDRARPWWEPVEENVDEELEDERKRRKVLDKAAVGLNGAGLFFGSVVRTIQTSVP